MASLETLPVELLDHVALDLDRESLHAFRFVCRTITSAINDTYMRRFYEHRTYLATPCGVQSFVEDTEQDDHARHLRCITFVAPGIKPVNKKVSTDSARRRKKAEARELFRAGFDEIQNTAARSGMVASLLAEGLRNLSISGYSPIVHPLRALKWLHVSLGPTETSRSDLAVDELADIFEHTPNLQHITLSLEPCGGERYLYADTLLWRWCAATAGAGLQSLTLEHAHVSTFDFLKAFEWIPHQLKCLHLLNICIGAKEFFSDFFPDILALFQLDELRLHDLKDANGWLLGFRGSVADIWIKDAKTEGYLPVTSRDYQVLLDGELPVLVPSDERGAGDIKSTLLELIEHEEYHLVDEAGMVVQTTKMHAQGEDED
ncbi:hypothetical protein LTR17_009488 [Elasticomyces elasticus]|nr:hypothetical protein LTR17_009488 [Elasticomyces elasticus]